jgi:hypothetical protein
MLKKTVTDCTDINLGRKKKWRRYFEKNEVQARVNKVICLGHVGAYTGNIALCVL